MGCEGKKVFSSLAANITAFQLAQADQGTKIKRGLRYCEQCKGYHIEVLKK